jgi:hypothetical protein
MECTIQWEQRCLLMVEGGVVFSFFSAYTIAGHIGSLFLFFSFEYRVG